MQPTLSIIIPCYNHVDKLPTLLDSVKAQALTDYEVLIMDDCSDQPYGDIIEVYRNKGMDILFIKNDVRQYTKETRLRGVEASSGRLITFLDADDALVGTDALKQHVEMILDANADMLQFGVALYKNGKINHALYERARPFSDTLHGRDIVRKYVEKGMHGHLVYGKIATRELWLKIIDPAREISVRRYAEDLLLCSLLLFHATSYVGSERIGYRRDFIDKTDIKACGRAVTHYLMLRDFIPYIKNYGADEELIIAMSRFFYTHLRNNLLLFMAKSSSNIAEVSFDAAIDEISKHIEPAEFLKVIMCSQVFQ